MNHPPKYWKIHLNISPFLGWVKMTHSHVELSPPLHQGFPVSYRQEGLTARQVGFTDLCGVTSHGSECLVNCSSWQLFLQEVHLSWKESTPEPIGDKRDQSVVLVVLSKWHGQNNLGVLWTENFDEVWGHQFQQRNGWKSKSCQNPSLPAGSLLVHWISLHTQTNQILDPVSGLRRIHRDGIHLAPRELCQACQGQSVDILIQEASNKLKELAGTL